jgi:HK97 gp10 family phage protein
VPSEITLNDYAAVTIAELNFDAERFSAEVAFRIEEATKDNAHVITGAMQTSVSAVTARQSHYAENVAAAKELNPAAVFAPEVDIDGPFESAVQVPVNYAAYEELGTSRQPAHPFFTPAIESIDAAGIAREVFGP